MESEIVVGIRAHRPVVAEKIGVPRWVPGLPVWEMNNSGVPAASRNAQRLWAYISGRFGCDPRRPDYGIWPAITRRFPMRIGEKLILEMVLRFILISLSVESVEGS